MSIAIATPTDCPAIAELVNSAYRGETARRGWTHEAEILGGQRTDASLLCASLEAGATILVWRDDPDELPVGCVSLEPDRPDSWYLGMLTVDPRRQAGGLGRQLLEAGEDFAKSRGARRITMTVIQIRESLIAWYERRGYRLTGATAPFPYGNEAFGEPRRPDLHFVVLEKLV